MIHRGRRAGPLCLARSLGWLDSWQMRQRGETDGKTRRRCGFSCCGPQGTCCWVEASQGKPWDHNLIYHAGFQERPLKIFSFGPLWPPSSPVILISGSKTNISRPTAPGALPQRLSGRFLTLTDVISLLET